VANTHHISASNEGLSVTAYRGDGSVLLGFSLDEHLTKNLAGFAVKMTAPGCKPAFLKNRLNFQGVRRDSTPAERLSAWTDSNQAPFQRFRWQHFPGDVSEGEYKYEVTAMYFSKSGSGLDAGPTADVALGLIPSDFADFEIGFTRSYVSSQAYATRFGNQPIRKLPKTLDYSTKTFQEQYEFLGYTARKMVFELLDACVKNKKMTLDVFAYDIDEPDIVQRLEQLGERLRIFMDDAPLHTAETALEPDVKKRLEKSAGKKNVKTGHFSRFSHDKIMIVYENRKPVRVLTGSANFSVRGLYVQANSVLVFDDPDTAKTYSNVFNAVWKDKSTKGFYANPLSQKWTDRSARRGLPPFEICFSPHRNPNLSLERVSDAIDNAESSVLFAVMQLAGGGSVMDQLKTEAAKNKKLFWYGVTQNVVQPKGDPAKEKTTGITMHKPGGQRILVPFAFLHQNVPEPFKAEINGGAGQVIHDKFVVTDFNGANPVVFCGSSNLANGGEKSNGDNLIAIYDRAIATMFGVEAIRLVDHFGFRAALKKSSQGLALQGKSAKQPWWKDYYNPRTAKYFERLLFVR
jgi:hypothetical protein